MVDAYLCISHSFQRIPTHQRKEYERYPIDSRAAVEKGQLAATHRVPRNTLLNVRRLAERQSFL